MDPLLKKIIAEFWALWALLLKPFSSVADERLRDLLGVGVLIVLLVFAPGLFFLLLLVAAIYVVIRATRTQP